MMILSQGYFTHSFTYVSGSIATGGDVGMQVVIMVETPRWDVSTYLSKGGVRNFRLAIIMIGPLGGATRPQVVDHDGFVTRHRSRI